MKVGLLWFDDSSVSLEEKIQAAVRRHNDKFGSKASICYVHPSMIDGGYVVGGIMVQSKENILRHHFWVGCEVDDEEKAIRC